MGNWQVTRYPQKPGGSGSQTLPSISSGGWDSAIRLRSFRAHVPAHPRLSLQEKVSQLKEEVRLQFEKLHQLLDEDLRQTVEVLDKAQAKFCSENAAQALHLGERMQEAKKLLGSLQLLFDKTEDVSFMKVGLGATAQLFQLLPTQCAHLPLPSAWARTCHPLCRR